PYVIAILVYLILYIMLKIKLLRKTIILTLISGLMYITGVLIFDHLGSNLLQTLGNMSIEYRLAVLLKDGLKMYSVAIFNYTLFSHITYIKFFENKEARLLN
ncbi:MAG: hypothetical protein PQJ44_01660, partial [Sphaerochaetaceae bacterium]|nr:hypothetical protein [Sphaerochaetaceae bacterium]